MQSISDVTFGLYRHTLTLTGIDLLVACVLVLSISVLAMALNRGRRVELRHSATTDILIVQLERIGDTLDRIVAQNASLSSAVVAQQAIASITSSLGEVTAALDPSRAKVQPSAQPGTHESQSQQGQPAQVTPLDESVLSDPVRSVIYSMLRS